MRNSEYINEKFGRDLRARRKNKMTQVIGLHEFVQRRTGFEIPKDHLRKPCSKVTLPFEDKGIIAPGSAWDIHIQAA